MVHEVSADAKKERMTFGLKLGVGIVVGLVMTGVVGPIALAIVIGLATGHR